MRVYRAEPYRTRDYPTLILVTNKRYDWLITPFQRYANIIHVQEDTIASRLGALRRQLIYRTAGRLPRALERLVYRLARTGLPLEWWQEMLLREGAVDAIVTVHPAFLPRKTPEGVLRVLWTYDDDVPLFFRADLGLLRHGYVDRVYVTHEHIIGKYREHIPEADVRLLPYAVPTPYIRPSRQDTATETTPFFLGLVTGGRKTFIETLAPLLEARGLSLRVVNAVQHDYSAAIRRLFIALDIPRRAEVNWRVFEVTGSGGLLIAGSRGEVEQFFPAHTILSYRGPVLTPNLGISPREEIERAAREAAELIIEALASPRESARRASEACTHAWTRHTIEDRVCTIIRDLGYKCREPMFERLREEMLGECRALRETVEERLEDWSRRAGRA